MLNEVKENLSKNLRSIKNLGREYRMILRSGLFDENWYIAQYPDVKNSNLEPLQHYILFGETEGRLPNVYFDLEHLKNQVPNKGRYSYFGYFCINEIKEKLSLNYYFDTSYYLSNNADVEEQKCSPFEHYIHTGTHEGRRPSLIEGAPEYFNQTNLTAIVSGDQKAAVTVPATNFLKPGNGYEEPMFDIEQPVIPAVKALAYYLPQFHPFKENDEWWGKGFTEWSNVTKAGSRFSGHYQPHLPNGLGYYDLRVKETMQEQAKLAKAAGIHGFCFYHYWFNGKRLMEKPVNMLLDNSDIDIPFCLMWANENWTRTWDGEENDVLIAQDYYKKDDQIFIDDLCRHFNDSRYIRVDGRPLFFIYRPDLIPNSKNTIVRWRKLFRETCGSDPLIYMAHAFGNEDPEEFGLDGAIEFPPHKLAKGLPDASRDYSPNDNFTGHYPSYDSLAAQGMKNTQYDYPIIRGVTPMWDNEARKNNRGFGFLNSTPQKYEKWLANVANYSVKYPIAKDESFVIINAWNEWAEGAHLEPDVYWGSAYLNATYRALNNVASPLDGKVKMILVGHDANKHGAQLLTLNIFKTLKAQFGIDVKCILLSGGPLIEEYKKIGPTYCADGNLETFSEILRELKSTADYSHAICNTTVTGLCTKYLKEQGMKVISLVHELPTLIKEYSLENHVTSIKDNTDKVIFAADFVKSSFETLSGVLGEQAIVMPQGIYQELEPNDKSRTLLRQKLNIPKTSKVVINSGYADLRKGFDIFIQIAKKCIELDSTFHFVWLGNVHPLLDNWILKDIENTSIAKHVHVVPFTKEISLYLQGSDAFAMTSREDPFPSVVLESLALGTPVVGFEGGGGFTEALSEEFCGEVVAMADTSAFAAAICRQISKDDIESAVLRSEMAVEKYDWSNYVFSLVELLMPEIKRVSVVIPNYNYEQHLEARIKSILEQDYPIYELIILDDNSSDESLDVIKKTMSKCNRHCQLIESSLNSGSVFKQWNKGAQFAHGEYLWIAEADDLADNQFLSTIMSDEVEFDLAYTDSKQVDENTKILASDYRYYYDKSMSRLLDKQGVFDGKTVISECLSVKNQFMNVSSVVFNTQSIKRCLDKELKNILSFKVAGDWFVYLDILNNDDAKCKFIKNSLNTHRRHNKSVTAENLECQINEIARLQKLCAVNVEVNEIEQNKYLKELSLMLGVSK